MSTQELERNQARFLGIDADEYLAMSLQQRAAARNRHIKKLRKEARELGISEDKHVTQEMFKFPGYRRVDETEGEKETVVMSGQVLQRISPESLQAVRDKARLKLENTKTSSFDDDEDEDEDEDEEIVNQLGPSVEYQEDLPVYLPDGRDHISEADPLKRDGVTVGHIKELEKPPVADLVGDRPPRTLADLYTRWPIAENPDYYIRVERTKPKKYGGVDVSGFIGEIRARIVKESDLHRWLGGTEYLLVLYGPDPRGRKDSNDLPIIKPLTEPITLTVPVVPPNVAAIPAVQGESHMSTGQAAVAPMNPFAAQPQMTNQHDAQIHKTNTEFATNMIKLEKTEQEARAKAEVQLNASVFSMLSETQKQQTEAAREAERERIRVHERALQEERESRKRLEEKMEKMQAELLEARSKPSQDPEGLLKLVTAVGPNREAETQRITETFKQQLETMKTSHDSAMKLALDRHAEDLKRADQRHTEDIRRQEERYKDLELHYKKVIDEDRRKFDDRERQLRDDLERVRREEREASEQRIRDAKERHEAEVKALERQHTSELRAAKEGWELRLGVSETQHKMQVESLNDKLQDAQEEAERAREEAKEASDPVKVLERAKEQAESLGYSKADDAPKSTTDKFIAVAGAGIGQALATIQDWGPKMLAARNAAAAAQLPPGAQAPQLAPARQAALQQQHQARVAQQQRQQQQVAQQQRQQRRRRGAQWATENSPIAAEHVAGTGAPLGFQPEAPPAPPAPQPQMVEEAAAQQIPEQQEDPLAMYNFPDKILQHFPKDAIVGFLVQAEQHIKMETEADIFGQMFLAQYPDAAKTLIAITDPEEIQKVVEGFPGSEESALVRTDGRKWMESLWNYLRKETGVLSKTA